MKFAPVCPVHIYEELAKKGEQYIGDYFLLLAHDVLAHATEYDAFFRETYPAMFDKKPFIIMDNSVIELGSSVSMRMLMDAVDVVGADVLAIPDVLQDCPGTYQAALNFVPAWLDENGDDSSCALMFIPQGNHQTSFELCVRMVAENPTMREHIEWIGIARNLTDRIYPSRTFAVAYVRRYFPEAKIHMLGFSDNTTDDLITCHSYSRDIVGIDSAVPLRIPAPLEFPIQDAGKRGDWWETAKATDQLFENTLEIRHRVGEID